MSQLALTDINNTSACLNFVRRAPDYGIRPVLGIDFRKGAEQLFVGLARNNKGFEELNAYLSHYSNKKQTLPDEAPFLENTLIIYPFEKVLLSEKTKFRPNEFIGISIENLRRLPFSKYRLDKERLVVQQPVTFRNKRDFNAHRLLRAIDNNTLLSKLQHTEQGNPKEKMWPMEELLQAYAEFPHIIENTRRLMDSCEINFDFGKDRISQNLQVFSESKERDFGILCQLCEEGLPKRYSNPNDTVRDRLKRELEVIKRMDFVSYFLINHDIVNFATRKGYFHVGRAAVPTVLWPTSSVLRMSTP